MNIRKFFEAWIEVEVRGGFTKPRVLLADIGKRVADEMPDKAGAKAMTADLRSYARDLFAKQRSEEKKWKKRTTNDALDAAFEALDEAGIVAIQNAGYTMSDGWEDCNEIARKLHAKKKTPRGATFYHGQDLERGVRNDGLMLVYGAYEQNKRKHEAASLAIARDVVATLERFGIQTDWNGDVDQRVAIRPFKWRRRQFTRPPK